MIAFGLLTDSSSASFPCSVTLLVLSAISPHPKQRLNRSCRMCLVFREVFRGTLEEKMIFMHEGLHFQLCMSKVQDV